MQAAQQGKADVAGIHLRPHRRGEDPGVDRVVGHGDLEEFLEDSFVALLFLDGGELRREESDGAFTGGRAAGIEAGTGGQEGQGQSGPESREQEASS